MVSQVTEYLNITGSNQIDLAVLRRSRTESLYHEFTPLVQGNIGIEFTMKLPIHMVRSCKFVRVDVCVGCFVVNLSVNQRINRKLDLAFSCGALEVCK